MGPVEPEATIRSRALAKTLAVGSLCAVLGSGGSALAHDEAAAPHLRCTLDGRDTLICLYSRHPTGPARKSRVGYADKGRYTLSCVAESADSRTFRTQMCRAGTGTATAFQCWTEQRRRDWLGADNANSAAAREGVTEVRVFSNIGIQETLLKLLAAPAKVGRPNFVEGGATGQSGTDIRDYARHCGIGTQGALTAQDVTNLLPTLAVFGRVGRQ